MGGAEASERELEGRGWREGFGEVVGGPEARMRKLSFALWPQGVLLEVFEHRC